MDSNPAIAPRTEVSADRLHGFGRFNLQNVISLPGARRVECPHTSVTSGGSHDAPHGWAAPHLRP
jgi:hypothetical protein